MGGLFGAGSIGVGVTMTVGVLSGGVVLGAGLILAGSLVLAACIIKLCSQYRARQASLQHHTFNYSAALGGTNRTSSAPELDSKPKPGL